MFPKYSIRLSSKPLVSLTILAAAMLAGGCSDNSSGSDNAADDNEISWGYRPLRRPAWYLAPLLCNSLSPSTLARRNCTRN